MFRLPPRNTLSKDPCRHLLRFPFLRNHPLARARHLSPNLSPHLKLPSPRAQHLPPLLFHREPPRRSLVQKPQGFPARPRPPSGACLHQRCPRTSRPGWPWPRRKPKPGARCPRSSSDGHRFRLRSSTRARAGSKESKWVSSGRG